MPLDPKAHPPGAPNFAYEDAWVTSRAQYLAANRLEVERLLEDPACAGYDQFVLAQTARNLCALQFGKRFHGFLVTSFLRGVTLNAAVGGSKTSQHCLFQASDLSPLGVPPKEVFDFLVQCAREGKIHFGQLLYEEGSEARETTDDWIHISLGRKLRSAGYWRPVEKCGQVGRKLLGMSDPHIDERIAAAA